MFTTNYSRTFRLTDRPFPVKALDTAYIGRSQQHTTPTGSVTCTGLEPGVVISDTSVASWESSSWPLIS